MIDQSSRACAPNYSEYSLRFWTSAGLKAIKYTDTDRFSRKPVLLCVPGVARNYQDFSYLSAKAAEYFRVICVSPLGTGTSERLPSAEHYRSAGWDLHINSLVNLISYLGTDRIAYVGTSLGGLFGIILAAQQCSPITVLVLNDVGPFIAKENFVGFNERLATDIKFLSIEHAEKYLKIAFRDVGVLSATQWREFTLDSIEPRDGDSFRLAYDLNIARQFLGQPLRDIDLWNIWDRVCCPVLVIRGSESLFLTETTLNAMLEKRTNCLSMIFRKCGHFPHLRSDEHIMPIINWLLRQQKNDAL
jgi:pimeloyl-ACP methyl ester carboxylesterase